jgi:alpha-ketoglutarate-dependent taurine dioxygenase
MNSQFSLENKVLYESWRDRKLSAYPLNISDLIINIKNPQQPDQQEIARLTSAAAQFNMSFYRFPAPQNGNKEVIHQLAARCGLKNISHNLCADADSLTSLQVTSHPGQHDYIPYTNKKLSWHTDGYYNSAQEQIHGMLLHCVRAAETGGESLLMDHDIAYILLREADPAYIEALMHPEAFTIPANILKGEIIRPEQSGPVFSVTTDGHLHMRYSARQRNVKWRDDQATRKAEQFLLDLWEQDSAYKLRYTLQAGEGLLCNNILHCRTAFSDGESGAGRLLYRGRYVDRVSCDTKRAG